jgi:5S rRNA maturation endonuclease (ribonuclease M5)
MAEDLDTFDIISEALRTLGGRQKMAGEYRMVQCPFHSDNSPSCGVYMHRGGKVPLGWFNCLGCGKRGGWNTFARKTGLPKIKEWDNKEKEANAVVTQEVEDRLLGSTGLTLRMLLKVMGCPEAIPWPEFMEWRGFKGQLLAAVGGLIVNDYYNDGVGVLFPVRIGKKVRGGVKAVYEKKAGQTGYITMKGGEWVEKYGLFPYDYTQAVIKQGGFNFVILVEGPRDALRLLKLGIPALAILGANTMSKTKAMFIQNMDVSIIYAMPDNDTGGSAMWKNVQASFKTIPTKRLKLPRDRDEEGKLIPMDPFSASREVVSNLKNLLREKNRWTPCKLYLEKKQ